MADNHRGEPHSATSLPNSVSAGQRTDGGVINDKTLRGFVNKNHNLAPTPLPDSFVVTVINPATQTGRGGFRVLQQQRTLQLSTLKIAILRVDTLRRIGDDSETAVPPAVPDALCVSDCTGSAASGQTHGPSGGDGGGGGWAVDTGNVRRFRVGGQAAAAGPITLRIDGAPDLRVEAPSVQITLHRLLLVILLLLLRPEGSLARPVQDLCAGPSGWAVCLLGPADYQPAGQRGPATYGPARRVFMRPFAIVVTQARNPPQSPNGHGPPLDASRCMMAMCFGCLTRLIEKSRGGGGQVGTAGTAEQTAVHLELGRYIAQSHFAAVGSYAPVVLDTGLDTAADGCAQAGMSRMLLHVMFAIKVGGL